MEISLEKIKKLREETQISIKECRSALIEAQGDLEKAKEILRKKYGEFAKKLENREAKEGTIAVYLHNTRKIGAMVKILCETDFVANSPDFQKLAQEICLQVAAQDPKEVPLLEQEWIKDPSKKIKDLVEEAIAKFGENIVIAEYVRFKI
jgi:elongation factor Ts